MQDRKDYIISCGASGSKVFAQFLYNDLSIREGFQFHRHNRTPHGLPKGVQNCIYLFSDPRNAVLSFFARREKRHERHGFSGENITEAQRAAPAPDWVGRHLRGLGIDPNVIPPEWDLATYLSRTRTDLFRIEEHFCNWLSTMPDPNVLFLRYETLWQNQAVLKEILGTQGNLPAFVPRAANWQSQGAEIQDGLEVHFGELVRKFSMLPDVFGTYGGYQAPLDTHLRRIFETHLQIETND